MKRISLLLTTLLILAFSVMAQIKVYLHFNDGNRLEYVASTLDSITFDPQVAVPDDSETPDGPILPDEELNLPKVDAPGEGYTTIVLYIPNSDCEGAMPYILGMIDGTDNWTNEPARLMQYLGSGWWKITVETLTPENAINFKFRMEDGVHSWGMEPKNSYELLKDAAEYLEIKFDEVNNLIAIANCDNKVLYIKSGRWSSTPCPTSAGYAKFIFTPTGGIPVGYDLIFTGNFDENPWSVSERIMTKEADGIYTWEGEYPENFRFKVFIKDCEDLGITDAGNILSELWLEGSDIYIETGVGPIIEFSGCLKGFCPGDEEDTEVMISTPSGYHNNYGYVDLGLPSGTLWATMNVGANSTEEYGDYFAWGETEPKEEYDLSTYKWCNGSYYSQTKYCTDSYYGTVDNKTVLDIEDDAANANWGGEWRMPTSEEQQELINYCTMTWATYNGTKGYIVTGPNGNDIFIPAAGYRYYSDLSTAGSFGYYWSSSLNKFVSASAYAQYFYASKIDLGYDYGRYYGQSVRPVLRGVPSTYTIMFDDNGGEGSMQSIDCQYGNYVTIPRSTFTREGYFFAGWNTKADGTGILYTSGEFISLTENLTLYAQWEEIEFIDRKLYFVNTEGWSSVGAFVWIENTFNDYLSWPGEPATKESITKNGYSVYSYYMAGKEEYNMIIFNDNMENGYQTEDLKIDYSKPYYCSGNWYSSLDDIVMYSLSFNANGGNGTMNSILYVEGSPLSIPSNSFIREGYFFVGWNTKANGTGTSYTAGQSITLTADITLYAQWKPLENGHEYVDLGLPSGTLWATCNVGANAPEEYGDYFAWGETETKEEYDWSTYKWCEGNFYTQTKYCTDSDFGTVDNKTILELSDDAANANWGGSWRMPTTLEQEELIEECTWTWEQKNGVNGYTVTGPNSNSIFLPAAGYRSNSDFYDAGYLSSYWSISLTTTCYGNTLYFHSEKVDLYGVERRSGRSIRPVLRSE